MLRLIQNDMKKMDLDESLQDLEKEFAVDPDENLNDIDDVEIEEEEGDYESDPDTKPSKSWKVDFQIEKMLRLIQNDMKGMDLDESLQDLEKEFAVDPDENLNDIDDDLEKEFAVDPDENLNDIDDVRLKRKKEIMNLSFEKNRKKPGDPDFEYDVEVDFSQVAGVESSMWDSEKDENDSEI
ncbi:hypothetical protein JTE90_018901 [Oedothorax gibbosus]|uniref:Centrosomal protein of 19 kDa n=1 Tax=Oedothorax gibbosus TaxID=931172 RepID=A0AAV6TPJ3_9ARAC|nr:hypothetical protein JTE90_018901 [Oedothorax gibbosus]